MSEQRKNDNPRAEVRAVCECEQSVHFDAVDDDCHAYGATFDVQPVTTDFGTFHLCDACRAFAHMR